MDGDDELGLAQAVEAKDFYLALQRSAGWLQTVGHIEGQIHARREQMEQNPVKSMDDMPGQQYALGEIAGMKYVLAWPGVAREIAEEEIASFAVEEEESPNG